MFGELLERWIGLAHSVGLTKQQILETYTQKYVLNKFRQDHGYKDGSYQKEWTCWSTAWQAEVSLEDNGWLEHLVNVRQINGQDVTDEDALYKELEALYTSRLNQ